MEIPDLWKALNAGQWQGSTLILGGSSTGKSTFGRYLYEQLLTTHRTVAYLDADVGQQDLAPPGAICIALSAQQARTGFPPTGPRRVRFVGSNSPSGHFLPLVLGIHYLQQFAVYSGAKATVVDTSGLIDPDRGATVLKWAKVELLRPTNIVALQREAELEPILAPLRPLLGSRLHILPVVQAARHRSPEERRRHRAESYRSYFQDARSLALSFRHLAVFPGPEFIHGQLLALEDRLGFTLALAILERANRRDYTVQLLTPWWGDGKIAALQLGKLRLDLQTFHDEPILRQ